MTRTHESGYSLVELLIVLALLGLITIAISGGIGFGARVWERAQTTTESGERVRGTQTFLRTLIGHVYPRESDPNTAIEDLAFAGDATQVSFLAIAPDAVSDGTPVRVELNAAPADGAFALSLQWQSETGGARSRKLLTSEEPLAFSFGIAQPSGEIAWSDTWDGKSGVPQLVRLRAPPKGHANRVWPELIIHPMIDKSAGCIYDAVSFSCRHG